MPFARVSSRRCCHRLLSAWTGGGRLENAIRVPPLRPIHVQTRHGFGRATCWKAQGPRRDLRSHAGAELIRSLTRSHPGSKRPQKDNFQRSRSRSRPVGQQRRTAPGEATIRTARHSSCEQDGFTESEPGTRRRGPSLNRRRAGPASKPGPSRAAAGFPNIEAPAPAAAYGARPKPGPRGGGSLENEPRGECAERQLDDFADLIRIRYIMEHPLIGAILRGFSKPRRAQIRKSDPDNAPRTPRRRIGSRIVPRP